MSATAAQLASEALRLLTLPEIPYRYTGTTLASMDCQGAVKYCAQQIGVKLNYTGSNDMFRNACSWVGTLAEAQASGRLVPGALAFIVKHDGQEGERYRLDGLGNANHVGIITLSGNTFSVDASSSAGKVRGQPERDAVRTWTHVGWLKALDYTVSNEIVGVAMNNTVSIAQPAAATYTIQTAKVYTADGGALNLRRSPSDNTDNRVGRAPFGATVEVLETQSDGWAKVKFEGTTAWVRSRYLLMDNQPAPTIQSQVVSTAIPPPPPPRTQHAITLSDDAARELYTALDAALFG